jgi:hypothetical protein
MSLRLRIKNTSVLAKQKIGKEIETLRKRLRSGGGDLHSLLDSLSAIIDGVLKKIGSPSFDPTFLPFDADPDPVAWNRNMGQLESDLAGLYGEVGEIKKARAEAVNAAMVASKEIQNRANYAQTLITDLRMLANQLDTEVVVAGDDFASTDRIDSAFPLSYQKADIDTVHGMATLAKVSVTNVVTPGMKIQVAPLGPAAALNRLPTPPRMDPHLESQA